MTDAISCVVCIKEVQWSCQHDCLPLCLYLSELFAFQFLKKASHLISLSFFHVLRTPHSQGLSGPLSFLFHVHSTTQQINLQILTIYQSLIHSINHPSHFLSLCFFHSLTQYNYYHLPPLFNNTSTIQYCTSMSFKMISSSSIFIFFC